MERGLMQEHLVAELGSWNRQEQQFRELFSEQALKDRSFMRMKLAEYNRLWYKYRGRVQTTDERALLLMLRFQRRKMERTLYRGLLTRTIYRAVVFVRATARQRQSERHRQQQAQPYLYSTIPVSAAIRRNDREQQPSQANTATARHHKHHAYNLGRRRQQPPSKRKGPAL